MDRAFLDRMKNLFDAARRLPGAERVSYLDRECGETPHGRLLRDEVESLLRSLNDAGSFLGEPTVAGLPAPANPNPMTADPRSAPELPDAGPGAPLSEGRNDSTVSAPLFEGPGTRIGPYKLLQQIGEGGFGVVFMAEQETPVRRRVALKIIKLGMDTRQVIARFEAERQALAVMDHPNIAKVHDGGATETGRPYFVMELVKGQPITTYCDEHKLPIPQRLDLFVQVCQAVQHAHTKGVIHRDIKPSNVLVSEVDGRPLVKVIDFGIAKATDHRLTEKTIFTQFEQMIGTPQYMSPEQAAGSIDIDTRTDVYSLGVLLYELLTGTTPFEGNKLRSAAYDEIRRIIREDEPPKPSTRLSSSTDSLPSVAAVRQIEPGKLTRLVRGDLDWIVMKALEKDRGRRYETANGLSADLLRFANGEVVGAAPPSRFYRLRKVVRRNRGLFASGAIVTVSLAIGLGIAIWQARIARKQSNLAWLAEQEQRRLAALEADAKAEALRKGKETARVAEFQGHMLSGIDIANAGVLLFSDLADRLNAALAKKNISEPDRLSKVEGLRELLRDINATDVAATMIDRTILKPAIEAIDKQFDKQPVVDAYLRQTLSIVYRQLALYDDALPLQKSALATREREFGNEHEETIWSRSAMGCLLVLQEKLSEGEPYLNAALEGFRRTLGEEHHSTVAAIVNLGSLYHRQGKLEKAESYLREGLRKREKLLGEDDFETIDAARQLAMTLMERGKLTEAEKYFRRVLEVRRRLRSEGHPDTLQSISDMGSILQSRGKAKEAEPYYREALEQGRRVKGESHPDTLVAINNMGYCLQAQGRFADAEPYFIDALARRRRVLGPDHPATLTSTENMSYILARLNRPEEAEPYGREALEGRRRAFGDLHQDTLNSVNNMAGLLRSLRRPDEAEAYYREALEGRRKLLGDDHPDTLTSLNNMGVFLSSQKRFGEAEIVCREAFERNHRVFGDKHPYSITTTLRLAYALQALARYAEAEPLFVQTYESVKDIANPRKVLGALNSEVAIRYLADFYDTWHNAEPAAGHAAKAAEWRQKLRESSPTSNPASQTATSQPSESIAPATAPASPASEPSD